MAGEHAIVLAGRPYGLRAGDEIVFRAASVHPQLGAVRNGTRGMVVDVAEDEHATVQLADGREASWDRASWTPAAPGWRMCHTRGRPKVRPLTAAM